jgi:hypothetical protein
VNLTSFSKGDESNSCTQLADEQRGVERGRLFCQGLVEGMCAVTQNLSILIMSVAFVSLQILSETSY